MGRTGRSSSGAAGKTKKQSKAQAAQQAAKKADARRVAQEMAAKQVTEKARVPAAKAQKGNAPQTKYNQSAQRRHEQAQAQRQQIRAAQRKAQEKERAVQRTREKKMQMVPQEGPASVYDQYQDERERAQAQPRKPRKKRRVISKETLQRRRRLRKMIAIMIALVVAVIGMGYSIHLIFRVKNITLQSLSGETMVDTGVYTQEVILSKLSIKMDDHFMSFRIAEQEELLREALPLLGEIEIMRDYPSTVLVRVAPAVETYTIQIADGWLVLSEDFRVMRTAAEKPNILQLIGGKPDSYVPGKPLSLLPETDTQTLLTQAIAKAEADATAKSEKGKDVSLSEDEILALKTQIEAQQQAEVEARKEALLALVGNLQEAALVGDITQLVFEGEDGISFFYQNRIVVKIGTLNSLAYKLDIVQYLVENKKGDGINPTDTGVLDVSYQGSDGTISTIFAQEDVHFPMEDVTSAPLDGESAADASSAIAE